MSVGAYAVVTTAWGGTYKPKNVYRVQEFSVDAAMDTDTDQWSITLGDTDAQLVDVLKRDNEVRMQIFARDSKEFQVLQTGFADEVGFDLEGNLVFNGRDMTAVAVDSQALPNQWENGRPDKIITKEAHDLRIGSRVQIAPTKPFKHIARDGSESYWEFWYRLMRKRSMWLWAEPDGALIGGFLNYDKAPTYYFGVPKGTSLVKSGKWIPVEQAAWKKTTTSRIGEIFVVGNNGTKNFVVHQPDDTIERWIKRPIKIITDTTARTENMANATAKEEMFDSMVGAVEWQLTVMETGRLIRQNTMAEVNLPTIGLHGTFFVVGAKTIMDSSGLYQVVRLREKGYALDKRIPSDPQLTESQGSVDSLGARNAAATIDVRWANCFVYAANNHHGPWAFKDFLAVLLAVCDCETGFRNVRQGGSEEHPGIHNVPSIVTDPAGYRHFRETFANQAGTPGSGGERAVGPMQLYSRPFKVNADKLYDAQLVDEFVGGRWEPCSNIQEAAIVLRGFARSAGVEAGTKIPLPIDQIWPAVGMYNGGPDWRNKSESRKYVECVKGKFPGYLALIEAGMTLTSDTEQPATGTKSELAQKILDYHAQGKYRDHNGQQIPQITAMRDGKTVHNQCGEDVSIDDQVLQTLVTLLDNGWFIGTNALAADHSCNVKGSTRTSRHPQGFAVDISDVGDAKTGFLNIGVGGLTCETYVIKLMDFVRGSMGPSQIICDGVGNVHVQEVANHQWNDGKLQPNWVVSGHRNHVHVGF
jgi:prophage tail gpP-like protein